MSVLQPSLGILDETDSGLDIDALKIVSRGVNALRAPNRSFLVITHYQRLLDYIVPDFVHVLVEGRVVKSGGKELALELEERGYAEFRIGWRALMQVVRRWWRGFENNDSFLYGSKFVTVIERRAQLIATERLQSWLQQFENFERQQTAPAWLRELRRRAFARFCELGFPTLKTEDWRFTSVQAIANTAFEVAPSASVGRG